MKTSGGGSLGTFCGWGVTEFKFLRTLRNCFVPGFGTCLCTVNKRTGNKQVESAGWRLLKREEGVKRGKKKQKTCQPLPKTSGGYLLSRTPARILGILVKKHRRGGNREAFVEPETQTHFSCLRRNLLAGDASVLFQVSFTPVAREKVSL